MHFRCEMLDYLSIMNYNQEFKSLLAMSVPEKLQIFTNNIYVIRTLFRIWQKFLLSFLAMFSNSDFALLNWEKFLTVRASWSAERAMFLFPEKKYISTLLRAVSALFCVFLSLIFSNLLHLKCTLKWNFENCNSKICRR